MSTTSRRAAPLPPEERRSAILAVTVPLLREFGYGVTTRQIAAAAQVAEGTLFRVFPDKDTLVRAAMASAFDEAPLLRALAGIDPALPLDARLLAIVTELQAWLRHVRELMTAVGMHRPPDRGGPAGGRLRHLHPGGARSDRNAEALARITELLEPDRDALTWTPDELAHLVRTVTFAGTHPLIAGGRTLEPERIVAFLLDGVRRRPDPTEGG